MTYIFDDDPVGAVLEYGLLLQEPSLTVTGGRDAWGINNVKEFNHGEDNWLSPALNKRQLLYILARGRNKDEVRSIIDRLFYKLEYELMIDPFSKDDNLQTQFRVVNNFGRELLLQDAHQEYIFGMQRVVERYRTSVVKIYNPDGSGIGTGFLTEQGFVATARHVFDDLPKFRVALENGTIIPHGEKLLPKSDIFDLALIKVDLSGLKEPPEPIKLCTDYNLLDDVVAFGYPPIPQSIDAYLVVNKGEISSEIELYTDRINVMVVSCLLRGGNSGGPVVNKRGHVIGIVSRNLFNQVTEEEKSHEGLGFAVATPSLWLSDLIQGKI